MKKASSRATKKKIKRLIAAADNIASRILGGSILSVGKNIQSGLVTGKFHLKSNDHYCIEGLDLAALALDAIDFFSEQFLKNGTGKIYDLKIPQPCNFMDVQRIIKGAFDRGEIPDRGFVYLAWRHRPQRFCYVGKAGSPTRVTNSHPKLAHALANSSTLSLFYPARSTKSTLFGAEASLIRIILAATDHEPENNFQETYTAIPIGNVTNRLKKAATYLHNYARHFRKIAE